MDFVQNVANVEDIEKFNDEDPDGEVDECWCFKKERSFTGPPYSQETVVNAPGNTQKYLVLDGTTNLTCWGNVSSSHRSPFHGPPGLGSQPLL